MSSRNIAWPIEEFEECLKLWKDGKSASVIAQTVGRTRSAIIGKMSRMKVERKDKKPRTQLSSRGDGSIAGSIPHSRKRSYRPIPPRPLCAAPLGMGLNESDHAIHLMDPKLNRSHCRWILGDPSESMFCGEPTSYDGCSWCDRHRLVATIPIKPRVAIVRARVSF